MTFHSGKTGTATSNGTELPVIGWDVQPTATMADFKNSKTGSFPKRESTFKDASFTLDIDFDFDQNPFAAPLGLTPGATITNTKLYLNSTAGLYWNFPSAIVVGAPQSITIEGKPATRIACVIDGTYSMPGGITP